MFAFVLCPSILFAGELPTQVREETLASIEWGTLTAANEKEPTSLLVTLKTDKGSYFLYQSNPFALPEIVADLASVVARGKAILEQNATGCMELHLLFGLRPDRTPDNAQANAKFYPERHRRAKFNSRLWNHEQLPSFNGLFLSEMPVPKMPAALGSTPMVYKAVSSINFHSPCIIEIQEDKSK